MKFIFKYIIFFTIILNANDLESQNFFSRVLPFEEYTIKANTSGKIDYVNHNIEGNFSQNNIIIKIDDKLNQLELNQLQIKEKLLNNMLKIEEGNYRKFKNISSKSKFEKDNQKLKVLNLKSTQADLKIKIATLKDKIENKTFIEKDNYIYKILVEEGNYINPGSTLYIAQDLSKAKLIIYIPISYISTIKNKSIYLNDIKTNYKISKLYNVADQNHLSTYKCEIIIDKPKQFSSLYKINFK